jgi:hypothetical protein
MKAQVFIVISENLMNSRIFTLLNFFFFIIKKCVKTINKLQITTASLIYMKKYTYNNDCDVNEKSNIIYYETK